MTTKVIANPFRCCPDHAAACIPVQSPGMGWTARGGPRKGSPARPSQHDSGMTAAVGEATTGSGVMTMRDGL
jgi:hypothetical protein